MDLQNYLVFGMPCGGTALPCATRPPAATRPRNVRPTPHTVAQGLISERTGPKRRTRRAGTVERRLPRSPIWRGIVKTWKPNTMQQQTVHERTHVLYVLYVLLYVMGGWMGRWNGCCTCCCCSTAAVVLPYMVGCCSPLFSAHWCCSVVGHGRMCIVTGTFGFLPVYRARRRSFFVHCCCCIVPLVIV